MGKSIPHRVRDALVQIKDLKQRAFRPEISAEISEKTVNLLLTPETSSRFGKYTIKRIQNSTGGNETLFHFHRYI